jgi:hypothetical protein
MPADNRALPGSVPERAKKALDQIRRGKPRKEIAKPAYAAEILFAFHREERHRKSLGIEKCSDADISQLCANLLQSPPRYIECLKFIARVPSTSTPSTGSTKSTPR